MSSRVSHVRGVTTTINGKGHKVDIHTFDYGANSLGAPCIASAGGCEAAGRHMGEAVSNLRDMLRKYSV